ncbi:NUDIX hydrolase [Pediococcus claussenii]|nr:NUDIX hydrolase [Pediococcus claussenii]ANZ70276.1 ADP-ribose pyrophosphatase [Pediococcus claussenii]ANZ72092.1 ADP-ribose pyrophosphatase [Pediococcus claussenii]
MNMEEEVVKSDSKYKGQIIDVYKQTVKLPNGELANRDVVKHQNAIAILAFTNEGKAIFEEQWRTPVGKTTIEIPAGKVEDGETYLETAKRELNEEVRLQSADIKKVAGFYSSPGFADEYMVLFTAKDLSPVETKLPQDFGENLNIFEYSLDEALTAVKLGKIEDAKTVLAIYYWQANYQAGE